MLPSCDPGVGCVPSGGDIRAFAPRRSKRDGPGCRVWTRTWTARRRCPVAEPDAASVGRPSITPPDIVGRFLPQGLSADADDRRQKPVVLLPEPIAPAAADVRAELALP